MDLTWGLAGQLAWTGIATSSYNVLFAVAFAIVLKVNRVWNFGQAAIMVFAYFAVYSALRFFAWPVAGALAFGTVVSIAASLLVERYSFRILRDRNASVLTYFIFTIALSQFAIYFGELTFGADPKTLFDSIVYPVVLVGPIVISYWDMEAIAVSVVLLAALAAFLIISKDGQFLLAVADNPDLAQVYGVNLNRAYAISMTLAGVLVVGGMYLVGTHAPIYPSSPLNQFLVLAVVATLLGGIGNIFAAGVAAIGLGLLQSFSILVISSTWQILLVYSLIFVTILLFPSGVKLTRGRRDISRMTAAEALSGVEKTLTGASDREDRAP
jgi:branched-subunit amino acid ABC-type transport system permease component